MSREGRKGRQSGKKRSLRDEKEEMSMQDSLHFYPPFPFFSSPSKHIHTYIDMPVHESLDGPHVTAEKRGKSKFWLLEKVCSRGSSPLPSSSNCLKPRASTTQLFVCACSHFVLQEREREASKVQHNGLRTAFRQFCRVRQLDS